MHYGHGRVAHTCNPSTWDLRQKDLKSVASVGSTIRSCLQKLKTTKKASFISVLTGSFLNSFVPASWLTCLLSLYIQGFLFLFFYELRKTHQFFTEVIFNFFVVVVYV